LSEINIKTNYIKFDEELSGVSRSFDISGESGGSTLDGDNKYKILTFYSVLDNATNSTISNIHFQNGYNKDSSAIINTLFKNGYIEEDIIDFIDALLPSDENQELISSLTTFLENDNREGFIELISPLLPSGENQELISSLTTFLQDVKKNLLDLTNGGGAVRIEQGATIVFNNTNFSNNRAELNGGAIIFWGDIKNGNNNNILRFNGRTTFTGNKSIKGLGGAIFAVNSDLVFDGEAEFKNNSSYVGGGAIWIANISKNEVNVTFNKLATFEGNSSNMCGAIGLMGNVNMRFNSGLKLIGNITNDAEEKQSGAIPMAGFSDSQKAVVTIVQKDPNNPTEFRGNKSGANGQNAFYLEKHAELNFTVENGNIDLYDVINGDRDVDSNTVTINKCEGWFSVRRGGSIDNVKLTNIGNLSLLSVESSELKPKSFINSGKIKFGIFEVGKNDKITADSITLNRGTILEIVAARGTYKKGQAYDILISTSAIGGDIVVNTILANSSQDNLKIRGELYADDKKYRIIIEENTTILTNPREMNVFDHLSNLNYSQQSFADAVTDILIGQQDRAGNIRYLLDELEKLNSQKDQKTAISQLTPAFIADVISLTLLDSSFRPMLQSREGVHLKSSSRISKLATLENDRDIGITLGFGKNFAALNLGIYLNINTTSLSEKEHRENKADITAGTLALTGETTFLKNTLPLNLLFNLTYSRNSYTLNRNIEKLNRDISSKFSSNVFSLAVDLERKLDLNDIVTLKMSLGLRSSLLTMSPFQENDENYLTLHLEQKTQQLTSVNLGLGIMTNIQHKLAPHIAIAGLFPVSASTPEITASLKDYPDNKFTARGTSYKNPSLSLDLGLDYKLSTDLIFSTNLNYITNSSYRSFDLGLGLGMKI
jgi:predicted outer membrane repeat protein